MIDWILELVVGGAVGSKRLAKPFVFISMSIAFVCFIGFGILMLYAAAIGITGGTPVLNVIPAVAIALLFFALAALSAYFVRRCFSANGT